MSAVWMSALFGAPWLAAIAWVRSRAPGSDFAPPSLAESAQRRLWSS